ncbi:signal peptidase II [Alpinimonas psychrophila]|uniref:Lipoprotein signal peptidase n=1 Tax=Alpinimonas psychrophila TaxID=748908 RepID=A0A7W3JSD2_9MICO|nr:signal peptidase II [Alpinimonas psychrophila]
MSISERPRAKWGVLVLLGVAAVLIYAADQASKAFVVGHLVEGQAVSVFDDILVFHFVRNPGAAFSLASGSTWIFSILAAVVTAAIVFFSRKIKSLAWAVVFGLLLGGTLGNLTDRLTREPSFGEGHVIDFISTPWMLPAIYNVADIAIVSSMILFVLLTIFGINIDGTRNRKEKISEEVL